MDINEPPDSPSGMKGFLSRLQGGVQTTSPAPPLQGSPPSSHAPPTFKPRPSQVTSIRGPNTRAGESLALSPRWGATLKCGPASRPPWSPRSAPPDCLAAQLLQALPCFIPSPPFQCRPQEHSLLTSIFPKEHSLHANRCPREPRPPKSKI